MEEEHQLWCLDADEKLCLVHSKAQPTPSSIAVMINNILYVSKIKNLFGKNEHDAKDFFIYMSCILSQDKYLPYSSEILEGGNLGAVCQYLPKIPNSSAQGNLLEYGVFLGFLEQLGRGYVVDPTRAITGVLPQIFSRDKSLPATEFVTGLAKSLPLLDGGVYRLAVEEEVLTARVSAEPVYQVLTSEQLSARVDSIIEADPDLRDLESIQIPLRRKIRSEVQEQFLASQRSIPPVRSK